jgi:hypothetical protein
MLILVLHTLTAIVCADILILLHRYVLLFYYMVSQPLCNIVCADILILLHTEDCLQALGSEVYRSTSTAGCIIFLESFPSSREGTAQGIPSPFE